MLLLLLLLLGPCVEALCLAWSASRPPLAALQLLAAGVGHTTTLPAGGHRAHGRRRSRGGVGPGGEGSRGPPPPPAHPAAALAWATLCCSPAAAPLRRPFRCRRSAGLGSPWRCPSHALPLQRRPRACPWVTGARGTVGWGAGAAGVGCGRRRRRRRRRRGGAMRQGAMRRPQCPARSSPSSHSHPSPFSSLPAVCLGRQCAAVAGGRTTSFSVFSRN